MGEPMTREWHMLAEGSDGPLIPCMAVEAIVRKALEGVVPASGARTAAADVSLADYENSLHAGPSTAARASPPRRRALNLCISARSGTAWDRLALRSGSFIP